MAIGVAADNVRRLSRQGQEMLGLGQAVLPEKRPIGRRDFDKAALARRPTAADIRHK
jgi:hypothetical protein